MPRRRSTSCNGNTPDDNDNDAVEVAKKPDPPEQVQDRRRPRRRSIRDTEHTAHKRADLTSSFDKKNTREDGRRLDYRYHYLIFSRSQIHLQRLLTSSHHTLVSFSLGTG